jgi:membrane protein YqaA with SNARE-associated domain
MLGRMDAFEWLLLAWAVAFVINLIPYFMPPTWAVVAFFLIAFSLPVWPLAIGCALASTAGRCGLYYASAKWGRRFLSAKRLNNVDALGRWLNGRPGWRGALDVLVYSLGPIPSNDLFIAAGLSGAKLWPVAVGFLPGRLVSYPVLALAARAANDRLGGLLTQQWHDPKWLALELLSIAGILAFSRVNWPRILHLPQPSINDLQPAATATKPAS